MEDKLTHLFLGPSTLADQEHQRKWTDPSDRGPV